MKIIKYILNKPVFILSKVLEKNGFDINKENCSVYVNYVIVPEKFISMKIRKTDHVVIDWFSNGHRHTSTIFRWKLNGKAK